LHISELSNKKGRNIFNLYKKGDVIKIKIIYINTSEAKIALSKKFIE
jgi:ribosomal protein S1